MVTTASHGSPILRHRRTAISVNYLGRYIKRPPLSQSRLKHYDGRTVAFDYLNHRDGRHRVAQFEMETFIDRLVQHIPEKHFRADQLRPSDAS
nr:transposase [Paraburkholderia mimosarum]